LEIKVSRGDFLNDIKHPEKQAPWRDLAHRHAYCVPEGLVRLEEVPTSSGLLVVHTRHGYPQCEWARKAPRSATARPLPTANVLDAFYRWSRAEAAAKGLTGDNRHIGGEEALRLEVERLTHETELLSGQLDRAKDELTGLRRRCAAYEPLTCSTCGRPLRPSRRRRALADGYLIWEHSAVDEEACQPLRAAVAGAGPDAWRYGVYVPGPEPVYPGDPTGQGDLSTSCAVR
jgi:hypothetical protein